MEKRKNKNEKKSEKATKYARNSETRVPRAVERLQARKPGEIISFNEIYDEVKKNGGGHMDTVARRLNKWVLGDPMMCEKGNLRVYKNGKRVSETKVGITGYRNCGFKLVAKDVMDEDEDIDEDEDTDKFWKKSSLKVDSKKKEIWKTELGGYEEFIAMILKAHEDYIGNGVAVKEKAEAYIRQAGYTDSEKMKSIDPKTFLRKIWKMMNYHNMKECDRLGIRIGIANDQKEEGQEDEFRVAQFNPDLVSDDPLPFESEFENVTDRNLKYIKKMKLRAFDTSEVWGKLEQFWDGKEAVSYMDFLLNSYKYDEIWAISFEILKLLWDNVAKEGMSDVEIMQELEEHIPATYMARKEFENEFKEALLGIEREGLVQNIGKRWMLGEKYKNEICD